MIFKEPLTEKEKLFLCELGHSMIPPKISNEDFGRLWNKFPDEGKEEFEDFVLEFAKAVREIDRGKAIMGGACK